MPHQSGTSAVLKAAAAQKAADEAAAKKAAEEAAAKKAAEAAAEAKAAAWRAGETLFTGGGNSTR